MAASSTSTPGGQRNTIIGITTTIVVVVLIILAGLWFSKRRAASNQQTDAWNEVNTLSAEKRTWPGASLRHNQQKSLSVIEEEGFGLDGLPLAPIMPMKPVPMLLLTRPTQRDSLVQQKSRYYQRAEPLVDL